MRLSIRVSHTYVCETMKKPPFKLSVVFYALVVLSVLCITYIRTLPDGKLHVVFCDVGQGDGIYMRFPDGADMVVDGGPGEKMMTCLGNHMGFWDRTIELVALTHPQHDHYGGLQGIVERYTVRRIILPEVYNNTDSYNNFIRELEKHHIQVSHVVKGDKITQHTTTKKNHKISSQGEGDVEEYVTIDVLWPSVSFIKSHTKKAYIKNDVEGNHEGENTILSGIREPEYNEDINNFSLVLRVSVGSFDVLLTGDAEVDIVEPLFRGKSQAVEVLKVPHHGSQNAVTKGLLDTINPSISVLSVGKNNSYGHPDSVVVQTLHDHGVVVKRTDSNGTIEIVSDGEKWWIE